VNRGLAILVAAAEDPVAEDLQPQLDQLIARFEVVQAQLERPMSQDEFDTVYDEMDRLDDDVWGLFSPDLTATGSLSHNCAVMLEWLDSIAGE